MRIVVTGATGNVGSSVIESLADDPRVDEIVGIARRIPGWRPPRTRFVRGDIRTSDLVPHLSGADVLIHLAWAMQPTHKPLVTWDVNVLGGIRTFEAAAAAGVPAVVHASSVGAYSPGPGEYVDETWPTHSMPTAAYGREKAYLERYLDGFACEHPDIRVVRMRPSFIFQRGSASQQWRIFAGSLLPRALVRPGRLPVVPLPTGLQFQALHARDAADGYRLAALSPTASGAYNLAADPVIDGITLARILDARAVSVAPALAKAAVGAGWRLRVLPVDAGLMDLFVHLPTLDAARARRELDWNPRYTGVEALTEVIEGMVEGAGAASPPLTPAG
jgi:nucleoside-diphosphate-sugar epimerase